MPSFDTNSPLDQEVKLSLLTQVFKMVETTAPERNRLKALRAGGDYVPSFEVVLTKKDFAREELVAMRVAHEEANLVLSGPPPPCLPPPQTSLTLIYPPKEDKDVYATAERQSYAAAASAAVGRAVLPSGFLSQRLSQPPFVRLLFIFTTTALHHLQMCE
jgi:hypothetical protein